MPERDERAPALAAIDAYLRDVDASDTAAHGHLAGVGAVAQLEAKLRRHYRVRHALCVSSATSGLMGLALALNLRRSAFVTAPLGYGGSISSWLLLGNAPVFADVEPDTLTLDPRCCEAAITPAVRAVLAVDYLGTPANHRALRALAHARGLWYVVDGAQSFGATRDGLPSGADADALVISFTAGKTLFSGEGGAVLTDNDALYERLLWWTQHPERQARELGTRLENEFGVNARLSPLAAIWANAKFTGSLRQLRAHQKRCLRLAAAVNTTGLATAVDYSAPGTRPAFRRLVARWTATPDTDVLERTLRAEGCKARLAPVAMQPIYGQPAFGALYTRRLREAPCCPVADSATVSHIALMPA